MVGIEAFKNVKFSFDPSGMSPSLCFKAVYNKRCPIAGKAYSRCYSVDLWLHPMQIFSCGYLGLRSPWTACSVKQ